MSSSRRPYVILSAAMTLDGKIATKNGNSEISGIEDWKRVRKLRTEVDGIMIGINTLLIDNPKLTVKPAPGKMPVKIVVDSLARTPPDARILKYSEGCKVIIAVTREAPKNRLKNLRKIGAIIVVAGSGRKVDCKILLEELQKMGVKNLIVEGGGTLNWGMTEVGLVDEVRVSIAPVIVGGAKAVTLVEGEGYPKVKDGYKLTLINIEKAGEDLVLTYRRN